MNCQVIKSSWKLAEITTYMRLVFLAGCSVGLFLCFFSKSCQNSPPILNN